MAEQGSDDWVLFDCRLSAEFDDRRWCASGEGRVGGPPAEEALAGMVTVQVLDLLFELDAEVAGHGWTFRM
jgi:hypothetical protein